MELKNWTEAYQKKLLSPVRLKSQVQEIRNQHLKIATLNGSFDLLHAGHLQIIHEASQLADVLIVALNTDQSIQKYKSANRPIIPLDYRLQMMAALEFVDWVTWFDETTPIHLLEIIRPDIHVNGAEYGENCIEAETVKRNGGKIHIVKLVPGLSTSEIVKKIKDI